MDNNTVCTDLYPVAHLHCANDLRTCAYHHIVTDNRSAAFSLTYRNLMKYCDITADNSVVRYNNSIQSVRQIGRGGKLRSEIPVSSQ